MGKSEYRPNIAVHPGKTLAETIDALNMTQVEFAERTGLTKKTVNEIIQGKNPITPDSAIKFAAVFGTSSSFWNNLQRNYDEIVARLKVEENLKEEIPMLEKFECYAELAKYGYVEKTKDQKEKVLNLLNFFEVSSLKLVTIVQAIAFRKTQKDNLSKESLAAWLRCGEIEAKKQQTKPFDKAKLHKSIDKLRALTKDFAGDFSRKLVDICASFGVAVTFVPHFKGTYVNGATKWINPDKALIQLSLKGSSDDIFWFSFFHELGHLVKHGKREQFVDLEDNDKSEKAEIEADEFASNTLIPKSEYKRFFERESFAKSEILSFAKKLNISPSIVAGRISHDTGDWTIRARFRKKMQFVDETA
ncbi:MAG: HigA family addiction module antitoxin [Candidatus Omnitrophota bacterium]